MRRHVFHTFNVEDLIPADHVRATRADATILPEPTSCSTSLDSPPGR